MWLYIDDVRPCPPDFDLHALNGKDALLAISTGKIIGISFDHDLGPEPEMTGYDVAKQIEEWAYAGKIKRMEWQIHSANPVGRKNIEMAMMNADKYWSKHENQR